MERGAVPEELRHLWQRVTSDANLLVPAALAGLSGVVLGSLVLAGQVGGGPLPSPPSGTATPTPPPTTTGEGGGTPEPTRTGQASPTTTPTPTPQPPGTGTPPPATPGQGTATPTRPGATPTPTGPLPPSEIPEGPTRTARHPETDRVPAITMEVTITDYLRGTAAEEFIMGPQGSRLNDPAAPGETYLLVGLTVTYRQGPRSQAVRLAKNGFVLDVGSARLSPDPGTRLESPLSGPVYPGNSLSGWLPFLVPAGAAEEPVLGLLQARYGLRAFQFVSEDGQAGVWWRLAAD